jgi:hypothetical protein
VGYDLPIKRGAAMYRVSPTPNPSPEGEGLKWIAPRSEIDKVPSDDRGENRRATNRSDEEERE